MTRKFCAFFITIILCISLIAFGTSEGADASYEASTMKLLRYDGAVEIFDVTGTPRFLLEGVRFLSGESMLTGDDGTASVGLDDTKIVSLDHNTRVEFIQEDNHMQLNLLEGELFLDVSEKLDENASFDIQTTTMTVGIRGTIISASSKSLPDGTNLTVIAVYEGGGEVNFQDKNGTNRVVPLVPGQQIIAQENLSSDGLTGVNPVVTDITGDNISTFAANEITSNDVLLNRVVNGSTEGSKMLEPGNGEDDYASYPANGDWYFPGEVVIVAQSASKLYDGKPLARPADALVYGLPGNFNISVSCSGSITNAGSTENVISSYSITNASGENVNSHFPAVRTVAGKLLVNRAPLTIWTGSAEKEYDGEPLTCDEAGIRSVSGYNAEEPTWQNTSIVTESTLGSEQMIAVSGRMFVHGSNPLTQETRSIELKVGQRLSVALQKGASGESLEFVVEDLTEDDIPEEVLRLYAENPDLLAAACEETKWDIEKIKERIADLKPLEEKTVSVNGLDVAVSDQENIMSDSANIRISVDTQITNYATRVLTSNEADFTPIKLDDSIQVIATGSQTEIGESDNTCEIKWGNANSDNYILSYDLGTLTVKSLAPVTLTAPSAEKVYDGDPLEADSDDVKAEGLPKGYTFKAYIAGSQTEVGESESRITSYKIYDKSKNDVTDNFDKVNLKKGKLTVQPISVSISLGTGKASYSGTACPITPTLTYLNGKKAGDTVSPTTVTTAARPHLLASVKPVKRAATGDKVFRFNLFTGDIVDLTISGLGSGIGSFNLTASVTSSSGNISCPVSSITGTSLTIEPAVLTIRTGSASKFYDGEPLVCADVTLEGLAAGDTIVVTATGAITEVGKTDNTYTIDWGTVDEKNYTVVPVLGILTVTAPAETPTPEPTVTPTPEPVIIYLYAPSDEKAYDGTPLIGNVEDVHSELLPEGYTFTVTLSGSQTVVGESDCTISSYVIKDASGKDVTSDCTVIVEKGSLTVTPCPIVFTTLGGTSTYGEEVFFSASCTVNGASVSGEITLNEDGDFFADYALYNGDSISFQGGQVPNPTTEPGTHYLDIGYLLDGDDSNYEVTVDDGVYTINKATLTITTPTESKKYDGSPDPVTEEATVTGDPFGNIWAEVIGSKDGADVGTHTNGYILHISYDNPDYFNIVENLGTLTIEKRDITITSASADKKYDGSPLTCEEFGITGDGLTDSDRIHCSFTGSQKDVGESKNEFTVSGESGTNLDNYNVTTVFGDLVVNKRNVTLTSATDSKTYDGAPLTNTTVTVGGDGFVEGEGASYEVTGTQTDAGSSANAFTYTLNEGTNVNNYNITTANGTLTVNPRNVTLTSASDSKTYDGTPLTNSNVTVSDDGFVEGQGASYEVTGAQTDVGTSSNAFSYNLNEGTNVNNYHITTTPGELTITKRNITITSGSAEKPYDGSPLTNSEYTVTGDGLPSGETISLNFTGSQTEVGSSQNTFSITGANASNYNVTPVYGTLTVTVANVTVTVPDRIKTYDGHPFDEHTSELSDAPGVYVTYPATTDPNAGTTTSTYTVSGKTNSYNITWTNSTVSCTIRKRTLYIDLGGDSLPDNGNWTRRPPNLDGMEGQTAEGNNYFTLNEDPYETVTLYVHSDVENNKYNLQPNTRYSIDYSLTFDGDYSSNYTANYSNGEYIIYASDP